MPTREDLRFRAPVTKPLHLRMDKSRPGDSMALGRRFHMLDTAMDSGIASRIKKSCLSYTSKNSDCVLKVVEGVKFGKDRRSMNPIMTSSTMRFIPLALNHVGMRGPHFQAVLKEFATILVTKPKGCSLLYGPFALTHSGALHKIPRNGGSRRTWMAQREHACQ